MRNDHITGERKRNVFQTLSVIFIIDVILTGVMIWAFI